jgi:hypothetical protein
VSRALSAAAGLDDLARRALEERSLIQSAADGSWTMHPLTRGFGQRAGSAES